MRREIRIAGSGGQGVITIGKIIGRAAIMHEKREAVLTEDYGPEKTGGWSRADVVVSDEEIGYPLVEQPEIYVAMSQDGFEHYRDTLRADTVVFHEAELVHPPATWDRPTHAVPALEAARALGKKVVANMVLLGAVVGATKIVSVEAARKALIESVPPAHQALNVAAFDRGLALAPDLLEAVAAEDSS